MEADTDDESEDDGTDKFHTVELEGNLAYEYCKIHFAIRNFYENHMEQHMGKGNIKCLECLYSCENKGTSLKGMNTKHPHKRLDNTENSLEEENNESESDSEDETRPR